jgi:hypothetical protein
MVAGIKKNELLKTGELEVCLDKMPDFLAPGIAAEYQRMKLELRNKIMANDRGD